MTTIEELEALEGMTDEDKSSILLVHGKLKPTAFGIIEGVPFPPGSETVHITDKILKELDAIITELDFVYETSVRNYSTRSGDEQEVLRISVAHNHADAKRLRELFDSPDLNHKEIGYLLGYPKTAVDAFLTSDMLEWDDFPTKVDGVSEDNMKFLGHRLSKDHWRDEVQYLEESGNYIKSISPRMYESIIQNA